MADLEDNGYQRSICVDTANSADNAVTVAPGSEAQLVINYRVERSIALRWIDEFAQILHRS